jgi:outer membrane protein OmpA-like peptidoglycan-associated protein
MKCRVLMTMMIIVLTGIFLPAWAQKNYYVVVGAFSTDGNAKEFKTQLPGLSSDTAYAMATDNGIVHLYVLRTTSEEAARAKSMQLQRTIEDNNRIADNPSESITVVSSNVSDSPERGVHANQISQPASPLVSDASSAKASASEGGIGMPAVKSRSKMFKFTIQDHRGQEMPGKIHFVDFARERDLASYQASTYTEIINPGSNADMALVCGIFGYKFTEKHIDYINPASMEGTYKDESGAWVIPYKLERLEKGDVSVMYNVSFHKDAVIMLPQSQSDLDELVRMMKENLNYEITIHGHCNGKNDRKITALNYTNSYFDIHSSKPVYGTAKELSAMRADAVKQYLIDNGIDKKRLKTYAWGGRYMLAEPKSAYAKLNDRIEIEIRKD